MTLVEARDRAALAAEIKEKRLARGLSLGALAALVDRTPEAIRQLELGTPKNAESYQRVLRVLDGTGPADPIEALRIQVSCLEDDVRRLEALLQQLVDQDERADAQLARGEAATARAAKRQGRGRGGSDPSGPPPRPASN